MGYMNALGAIPSTYIQAKYKNFLTGPAYEVHISSTGKIISDKFKLLEAKHMHSAGAVFISTCNLPQPMLERYPQSHRQILFILHPGIMASFNSTTQCSLNKIPDFNSMNISKSISALGVPRSPDTMKAATTCCAPNPVNIYDNCTLWCQIPERYINGTTGKHSDKEEEIATQWETCLQQAYTNFSGITGVRLVGAAPLGPPPTLTGLGMLLLGVSAIVSVLD
jgi:hypothetical protein